MILLLKLLLTPCIIAIVSLAGRRWGPAVSGLLTGLPVTSAPISFIFALQNGSDFAARAAVSNLPGQASVCIFCAAYSVAARRWNWFVSTIASVIAFALATLVWNNFSFSLLVAFALLAIVIVLIQRFISPSTDALSAFVHPRWDLPARMLLAAILVILLTAFASSLGPQLSGLLAPFPIVTTVLAAFTQYQQGANAAVRLVRGVVLGSWGAASFFLIIGGLLPSFGIGWVYALAVLAAISMNGVALYATRMTTFQSQQSMDMTER